MTNINKTIGERMRTLRRAQNISQRTVANALGLSDAAVSALERGKVSWQASHIAIVATLLGVARSVLLDDEPLPSPTPSVDARLAAIEATLARIEEMIGRQVGVLCVEHIYAGIKSTVGKTVK